MERVLIFIKHKLGFVWRIIELVNDWVFNTLYGKRKGMILPEVFSKAILAPFRFRVLEEGDMGSLFDLLQAQPALDLEYFQPHRFDMESLKKQMKDRSFLMMGVFDEQKLVGYFFLRFFMNRKCFVGRLIDKDHRGEGIGHVMNQVMYETAWDLGFRCMSTISRNNTAVMRAHKTNRTMVVLKELQNDYLLVEFIRKESNLK